MAERSSIASVVALIAIGMLFTMGTTVHAAGSQDGHDELDTVPVSSAYASDDISPGSSYSDDGHVRHDNDLISYVPSPLTLADLPDEILARHLDPDSKFRLMQTASHFRNAMHRVHPEFHNDDIRRALERDCGAADAKQILQQTYGLNDDADEKIQINYYSTSFVDSQGMPGACAHALRKHCERWTLSPKQPLRFQYFAPAGRDLTNILTVMDTLNACEIHLKIFHSRDSTENSNFNTAALSTAIATSRALYDLHFSVFHEPLLIEALAEGLKRNRSLRHLFLMNTVVDARGIGMIGEALAANAQLPLENLKISGQAIGNRRAAAALVEGIRVQRNLRRLDLPSSYLDDESMHELADALVGHTALAELELSHGEGSCYGITPLLRHIAHNDLPSLSELKLRGAIQDGQECAPALAAMLERSTSLDLVDLVNTGLTDAGVEIMVHALERKLERVRDAVYRGGHDSAAPKLLRTMLIGGMGISQGVVAQLTNVLAQNANLMSGHD